MLYKKLFLYTSRLDAKPFHGMKFKKKEKWRFVLLLNLIDECIQNGAELIKLMFLWDV